MACKLFPIVTMTFAAGIGAQETGPDRVMTANPRYDVLQLRPSGFEPRVTAMAFRPDGKLVIATVNTMWGSWGNGPGATARSMYLLEGVDGADPEKITVKKIGGQEAPASLLDPQGIVFMDGAYYVSEKDKLVKLEDTNGDDVIDKRTQVAKWKWGGSNHEFAFGPVYKDGSFFLTTSVQLAGPGPSAKVQKVDERGTVLKVTLVPGSTEGKVEVFAGGLRTPNGIGLGPRGELFVADNQGSYLPSSKLINVRKGRTYGHLIDSPVPVYQNQPVSPPVVWTPHGDIGRSPGQPVLMTTGPYAGQMVFGDLSQGGVKRVFLDEVDGEFQGAIMPLSGGLEGGVHRILLGPDGSMYLGGLGNGDQHNWGWLGKLFALQRLKPNGKTAFEILAVRSRKNGMEIEFTEPIAANYNPAGLEVWQWWYEPLYTYGGPKKDRTQRKILSRQVSPDGKSIFLEVEGLKTGWVTHVRANGIKSASGRDPFVAEAWYTLNAISPTSAFETTSRIAFGMGSAREAGFRIRGSAGGISASLPAGSERLEIRDLSGALVAARDVHGMVDLRWETGLPGSGLYVAILRTASGRFSVPFPSR